MNISLRRIEDKSGYCFAFSLCDGKGPEGVRSLYNMIPKEELGYEILTELVMVLKWKLFEYDNKKDTAMAGMYKRLYEDAKGFAEKNLQDQEFL